MTERFTRHHIHMIKNIVAKTLGCITVRAALSALADTRAANTIAMMAAETAAKEWGIHCHTCHTSTGMHFVIGTEETIEVSIKVTDAAKRAIVSKALETIETDGFDKEKILKNLLQTALEQVKKQIKNQ